jgi:hypothetical protein
MWVNGCDGSTDGELYVGAGDLTRPPRAPAAHARRGGRLDLTSSMHISLAPLGNVPTQA